MKGRSRKYFSYNPSELPFLKNYLYTYFKTVEQYKNTYFETGKLSNQLSIIILQKTDKGIFSKTKT